MFYIIKCISQLIKVIDCKNAWENLKLAKEIF